MPDRHDVTAIIDTARRVANLVPVDVTPQDTVRIADAVSALWEDEIEALREILRAFTFNHTTLLAKNGDPIYTAVGSLTGDQQDTLRLVLNPVDSGSLATRDD